MDSHTPFEIDLKFEIFESCLQQLDDQYRVYTDQARQLAEAFTDLGAQLKVFLPILITVTEDKRCTSTTIRWSRIIPTGKGGGKKGFIVQPIRKGRSTHRYPVSAFAFLEPDLRARVNRFEDDLSVLRTALAGNRSSHRHIMNNVKKLQRMQSVAA